MNLVRWQVGRFGRTMWSTSWDGLPVLGESTNHLQILNRRYSRWCPPRKIPIPPCGKIRFVDTNPGLPFAACSRYVISLHFKYWTAVMVHTKKNREAYRHHGYICRCHALCPQNMVAVSRAFSKVKLEPLHQYGLWKLDNLRSGNYM